MGTYTEESLQLLRQRIDLAEVLSSHIDLKRAGASYKALCPFHDEKTPSFMMHKGDSHYHCFGCGAHGDAITFLMSHLKMSFTEAIESLAEKFHVNLEKVEQEPEVKGPGKVHLKEVLKEAKRFYHFYLLHTEEGHRALRYLYGRGLDLNFVKLFEIGFAPKTAGILQKMMRAHHIDDSLLELVGLLTSSHKEFFINRLMFPIKDSLGSVIGFSGRKIQEETFGPKYINTPETPLFKKSHVLYGLSECRKRIAKEKKAIVVEGQIDTLRLIQEGFDLTVAGQGTAFTADHVKELLKLGVQQIYLAFDGDEAGKQATIKVGDLFQKEGIEVLVVCLGVKEDPDSVLREKGAAGFLVYLRRAVGYLEFLVEHSAKAVPIDTPAGKHQLVQSISQRIRGWNHPLLIHESFKKLATLLKVPHHLIQEEKYAQDQVFIKQKESVKHYQVDPDKILEAELLRWLLLFGSKESVSELIIENITIKDLIVPSCKRAYEVYLQRYQGQLVCDLISIGNCFEDDEGKQILAEILQRKINPEKIREGCITTLQRILERNWLKERDEVRMKIQSGVCSEEEVLMLAKRFDELKKSPPQVNQRVGASGRQIL